MSEKHTYREEELQKALLHRLSRVEGQVRGVKNMLEQDAYCIDILYQVSAIRSALSSFAKVLLEKHLNSCVREGIGRGDEAVIDELMETFRKFMA